MPRCIYVPSGGSAYLFDCPFDEALDDYPECYDVYLMPLMSHEQMRALRGALSDQAIRRLGRVLVSAVRFDTTRRKEIDLDVLQQLDTST